MFTPRLPRGSDETNSLKELAVELKESTVFPLLLNPFQVMCLHLFSFSCSQITKMTCGSLITFYDSQQEDATVAVDVCLTALIIAKVPIQTQSFLLVKVGVCLLQNIYNIVLRLMGPGN